MRNGYIERKVIKCLIVGAAGVGKTSIKHLILNKELPIQRESTGVMENPAVAVSVSRPVGISCASLIDGSWHTISNDEELIKMMAEAMKAGVRKSNIPENSQAENTQNQVDLDNVMANLAEALKPEITAESIHNKLISAMVEAKGGMS